MCRLAEKGADLRARCVFIKHCCWRRACHVQAVCVCACVHVLAKCLQMISVTLCSCR